MLNHFSVTSDAAQPSPRHHLLDDDDHDVVAVAVAACFSLDYIIYCNILFPNRIFIHLRFYFLCVFSFLLLPRCAVAQFGLEAFFVSKQQSEGETTPTTTTTQKRKIHRIHKKCKRKRIERSAHTRVHVHIQWRSVPCTCIELYDVRIEPHRIHQQAIYSNKRHKFN